MNQTNKTPAYKEPWFWMVMGPLLVVVVVVLSMAGVAIWVADDRVQDNYYKEGRMINKHFAEEELALALNVSGVIDFDFTAAEVLVDLDAAQLPAQLELTFSHPAEADNDLTVIMSRVDEQRYRADLPPLQPGRWYLIIANHQLEASERWRVTTEVNFRDGHRAPFSAHL